jgi:cytoskeleton protein RodZ
MSAQMRTLGETLRRARLDKGLSLADAARDTRIRRGYLEALEAEDFNQLPPSVYTRGFVRTYAEYLGLNPQAMVDLYQPPVRREREPSPQLQPAVPRVAIPRALPLRPILLTLLGVVALAGLVLAWNLYQSMAAALREGDNARAIRQVSPTTLSRQPTVIPLAIASVGPSPSPTAEPTAAPLPLPSPSPTQVIDGILVEVRALSPVYVEASVDGQQVLAETLPAGAQRALPLGKNVVIMRVSKGNAVDITLNGKHQDPSNQAGVVEFTWRR